MKKFLNALYIVLAIIGGMWLNMQIIFKGIIPLRPVQNYLQQKVTDLAGRPVEMKRVLLHFSGLSVENVRVAHSPTSSNEENLFSAKEIFVRWNLWYLLKGHIRVNTVLLDGLTAHIVRYEDGSFNFDGLFSSSSEERKEPTGKEVSFPNISLKNFVLQNSHFSFSDEQKKEKIDVSDVYLSVQDFNFSQLFPVSFNADILYQTPAFAPQKVEMGFSLLANLKEMDLSSAEVIIKHGVIKHEGGVLVLEGKVQNFLRPNILLSLKGQDISQKIADFFNPDIPAFSVEDFTLDVAAVTDWQNQRADVSAFRFSALDSVLSLLGSISWGTSISFNINADTELNLNTISQAVSLLNPYQLGGTVSAVAHATKEQAQAEASLQAVAAHLPMVGNLKEFNTKLVLENLQKLNVEKFEGILNEGPFQGALALERTEQDISIEANLKSERLVLPTPIQQQKQESAQTANADSWPFPPIHAKVNVEIDSLDAPFIYGKDIRFAADMRHITTALSKAHGTLSLHTAAGEIKDLNKLTNANAVTKVMFSSLKVVSDVINSLNVFGVLSSIGGGISGAKNERAGDMVVQTVLDENGNEVQIMVPHDSEKIDGRWAFEQFATDIKFDDGVADVERGTFVSDMLSFNLQGEMNFQTQALDMQVNAAPGRHYEGGIMPLTLDIGGTMTAPQGKMNLSSSMFSTVTQGVGNNVVSRTVKKIFGGIGSLFKGNEKEEDPK